MAKVLTVAVVVLVAAAAVFGGRWYLYVSNTTSPYDEVGIEINSRLPGPLNRWGCDKLHATFGNVVPPYGCAGGDGTTWR
ncbi:hypothetical protein [Falsirhodobacter sp. 20TX0035]|uniref:hypothetical protein n=1 Tax=Falsirhodobacter sp. 20TX0035 TaxID=3022019 RepID=UPI00233150FF|nr:hypothetical protein [Falsirhodobacter sp. 20TX0035]MDB6454527.1 hypothetical protein [Falsirhodobacter sp. 20TX0035]